MLSDYKKLIVWQKAMRLAELVYILTSKYPKQEQYGIVSQMRRSAVSIPSNIAEGVLRRSSKELRQFLFVSFGSGGELETQIELSKKLFKKLSLDFSDTDSLLLEVMKMLNSLITKVDKDLLVARI